MAVDKRSSWCDACNTDACSAGTDNWGSNSLVRAWSGSKSAATCSSFQSTASSAVRNIIKNDKARELSQRTRERRTVRFKGVPRNSDEPAGIEHNNTLPNGEVRKLRGFNDAEMHELHTVIALRDAKALAMSLGLKCRFL